MITISNNMATEDEIIELTEKYSQILKLFGMTEYGSILRHQYSQELNLLEREFFILAKYLSCKNCKHYNPFDEHCFYCSAHDKNYRENSLDICGLPSFKLSHNNSNSFQLF